VLYEKGGRGEKVLEKKERKRLLQCSLNIAVKAGEELRDLSQRVNWKERGPKAKETKGEVSPSLVVGGIPPSLATCLSQAAVEGSDARKSQRAGGRMSRQFRKNQHCASPTRVLAC